MFNWLIDYLDNRSYMNVPTFVELPDYRSHDRTDEFLRSHKLRGQGK